MCSSSKKMWRVVTLFIRAGVCWIEANFVGPWLGPLSLLPSSGDYFCTKRFLFALLSTPLPDDFDFDVGRIAEGAYLPASLSPVPRGKKHGKTRRKVRTSSVLCHSGSRWIECISRFDHMNVRSGWTASWEQKRGCRPEVYSLPRKELTSIPYDEHNGRQHAHRSERSSP